MPLSLSNRDQNSGHLFYNRRLRAATTRFSVRMKHDDRKQTAALVLSIVLVAIAAGWMVLLNVLKPSGVVGDSAIIGDRESGAIYARIDGRLYPALNLTSARLATGDRRAANVGEAGRDCEVPDRTPGRYSGRAGGDGGASGRRVGVGGVRYGGAPAHRG